jgi:hypothetical protein
MKETYRHPAHEAEDLTIKNKGELKEAKIMAGVTKHDDVMRRFQETENQMDGYFALTVKSVKKGSPFIISFNDGIEAQLWSSDLEKFNASEIKAGDIVNIKENKEWEELGRHLKLRNTPGYQKQKLILGIREIGDLKI